MDSKGAFETLDWLRFGYAELASLQFRVGGSSTRLVASESVALAVRLGIFKEPNCREAHFEQPESPVLHAHRALR